MNAAPFGAYGLSVSILLVSIMLAIGGVVLGVGHALSDKKLKEWGKNEIVQSLINGALVGGFLLLFVKGGIIGSFINSLTFSNGASFSCSSFLQYNSAICFAYNYLVGPAQFYFMGAYHPSILSTASLVIAGLVSLYAVLGVFRLFLSPVLAQIQGAVQVMGTAAISATVQAAVLSFIAVSALTIILPSGLVLRTFYPTRKIGSFLIALTIGMYIVLPLTYLMNATIVGQYSIVSNQTGIETLSLSLNSIKSSALSYVNAGTNNTGIIAGLENIGNSLAVQISDLLSYLFNIISFFIVYTFILPAFSLMLTGISVKELSALMGSDSFFGKFSLL